jgi:hypothetical protein
VAECGSGDLRLFNPTAAFIWRALQDRLSEASIARALARDFGIDPDTAHADVAATLDAWGAAGLAHVEGHPARRPPRPSRRSAHGLKDIGTGRYRLGQRPFSVRYRMECDPRPEQSRFHERVAALLAPLEHVSEPLGPQIELIVDGSYRTAYGPLCREIVDRLFGPFDWLFTLHAAVLARAAGAVALCAAQGGGKSTLTAYLAARGWRYFNDDLAIVDPAAWAVLPLPVAVGVKEGSRRVLAADYPRLDETPVHRYGSKAARYLAMPRACAAVAPAPLAAVVFTRYEAGAVLQFRRVTAVQAALRLMETGIVFAPALRPAMLEWMSRFVQCIPCHELRYSDLRQAEMALRTIS